jgi:hypothetical protein
MFSVPETSPPSAFCNFHEKTECGIGQRTVLLNVLEFASTVLGSNRNVIGFDSNNALAALRPEFQGIREGMIHGSRHRSPAVPAPEVRRGGDGIRPRWTFRQFETIIADKSINK